MRTGAIVDDHDASKPSTGQYVTGQSSRNVYQPNRNLIQRQGTQALHSTMDEGSISLQSSSSRPPRHGAQCGPNSELANPSRHPADAMNEPDRSPQHQPVDWEWMASLGLYGNHASQQGQSSSISSLNDMFTALPSIASTSESASLPTQEGTSLQPSNSIRSQRNWSEFDGHPVSPLPSPMIRSNLDTFDSARELSNLDMPSSPTAKLSRTQAFFSPNAHLAPPKPPQTRNISRSASSRVSGNASDVQRTRQRALSSPFQNAPPSFGEPIVAVQDEYGEAKQDTLLNPMRCTSPNLNTTPLRLFVPLPAESKTAETSSRHVHGPSVHVTNDSINPSKTSPLEKDEQLDSSLDNLYASSHTADPDHSQSTDPFSQSVDLATEQEDDQEGYVGPYRVLSRLGTGAFSKVLLAEPLDRSSPLQGRVALKMIACKPWEVDKRMRVSWIREAQVLRHISHPNIVRFVDSFRTPNHYTLVLDAIDGGELFDLLAHHQSSIAQREWLVRRIFGELASAVSWMHQHNLVHRDIKLENIMLTRTLFASQSKTLTPSMLGPIPLVRLTDFGLARFIQPDQLLQTRCGSEEYAAPELIIGKKYDGKKTDTWALGVVLFALLTGGLPFLQDHSQPANRTVFDQPTRERHHEQASLVDQEAKLRKAHLLRIAKGELRWPERCNDLSENELTPNYEHALRLATPQAKRITQRYLRRDASRRANCSEIWKDPWFLQGSFNKTQLDSLNPEPNDDATILCVAAEDSASNQRVALPYDPTAPLGRTWAKKYAYTRDESTPDLRDLPL
ncbi:tRNA (cytidine(32)/guanosine(34)-2'-O)-methyltransferase [Malassezia yamatoensis]|uniref:tRNA (Cytidine(32)/guanosine(34)-2'-O)-methyltransferase n=1 Tax=Malassezia yamatoensis TaxID=253288 RepID=A0AAJ5YUC4_9BASI|nr:tRNA (cytidine(32)/guanosine(34)-2'-O)-methyltransferase [Malassezia yamatoensis]